MKNNSKYVQVNIQLTPNDKQFIKEQADILNMSFNQYIRNLIREHRDKFNDKGRS